MLSKEECSEIEHAKFVASQPASARPGCWMQTYTGKQFYVLDPRPEDIEILDIAHSLAYQCRYNGHCLRYYSVAEHSAILAGYTEAALHRPARDVMRALLHDAVEAYVCDVPKPIKDSIPLWKATEDNVEAAIMERFGMEIEKPEWLDEIDHRIWYDEKAAIMVPRDDWALPEQGPLGVAINCLTPLEAENLFMRAYQNLSLAIQRDEANVHAHDPRCALCGPANKKMHAGRCK